MHMCPSSFLDGGLRLWVRVPATSMNGPNLNTSMMRHRRSHRLALGSDSSDFSNDRNRQFTILHPFTRPPPPARSSPERRLNDSAAAHRGKMLQAAQRSLMFGRRSPEKHDSAAAHRRRLQVAHLQAAHYVKAAAHRRRLLGGHRSGG